MSDEIKINDCRFRKGKRVFLSEDKRKSEVWYVVEAKIPGHEWMPLGDNGAIRKFSTEKERDSWLDSLK